MNDRAHLVAARAAVATELQQIDLAASRFRPDSELLTVNRRAGAFVRISPLLAEAIAVALRAAELTDGAVDPTLGGALRVAGYDRDFAELTPPGPGPLGPSVPVGPDAGPAPRLRVHRPPAWRGVRLERDPPAVRLPPGVELDLGATAKALAADRAAAAAVRATGAGGVLVALGGDIALAGAPPPGGWRIHVAEDHRAGPDAPGQTVEIDTGGLATSSTTTRRWRHAGTVNHHILDPATVQPAGGPWRTASVVAACCVDANIASTAAIVMGESARGWLAAHGLAARLVDRSGAVTVLGGWPEQA